MQYQSLERALHILLAFETQNKELGTAELSDSLGIHRSTVNRILKVLAAYEFLEQTPETKKYSLGKANIRLAGSLKNSLRTNMVQIAKPYVDDLRDRVGETSMIETLAGRNWVMAYVAEAPGRIRLIAEIGERMPIHIASGGKAFLAFSSLEVRTRLLGKGLARFTKNTITDPRKLERHFAEIRRQGFAFDKGEYEEGFYAVGSPVLDYQNRPVASVSIAGPPQRITGADDSMIVSALKETARKISNRLGSKGS
jgi:IclR family transcriptional regulator, KDG regulon repressor